MTKFKKIMLTFILCFIIFLTTGCASIQYERVVNTDGTILDAVSVKLDKEKITNAGFNIETVTNDVKNKMNLYLNALVQSFYNRDDGLLDIEKIAVYNNLTTGVSIQNDYIIASIKFRNYNSFRYFYGLHLVEDTKDDETTIKGFLFNKNLSTGKTIFSGSDAEFITNEFMSYFNNKFTINDAKLSYVFGTPESKIHSDSNYEFSEDGINYHQWIITNKNQEITTFTYQMKPVNWYILAIALTCVLIIVLFIISLFKRKDNNKIKNNLNDSESIKINENI